MGVLVSQIFPDSAIVQWTIPAIEYTPETYVVEYGTHPESLLFFSESLSSRDDITAMGKVYKVELKDLRPGTKYYFDVIALNSDKLSKTNLSFFYTKETGKWIRLSRSIRQLLMFLFSPWTCVLYQCYEIE